MEALEFIPEKERPKFEQAFDRQQQIEAVQFLEDLGYITDEINLLDASFTQTQLSSVAQFRKDYQFLLKNNDTSNFQEIYAKSLSFVHENQPESLSEREHFLLSHLIGLEGDFTISSAPKDETTLLSRVIIYRFKIYDLNIPAVDSVFDDNTIKILNTNLIRFDYQHGLESFANMLADQDSLSEFVINSEKLNSLLFNSTIFFRIDKRSGRRLLRSFRRQVDNEDKFLSVIPDNNNKPIIRKIIEKGDEHEIDTKIQMFENQFLIRVLQVKLWVLGMYEGKLDTDFGDQTYLALKELLDYLSNQDDGDAEEIPKLIYAMRKKQWAFNIEYFLKVPMAELEGISISKDDTSVSKVYDHVLEKKPDEISMLSNIDNQFVQQKRRKINNTLRTNLMAHRDDVLDGKVKRHYKGRKGLLRLVKKLFKLVEKPIKFLVKLIRKLIKIIKKSIKVIFDEIKEAIRALGRGLKFLFGKRIIQTQNNTVSSDFDFDFDGITVVKESIDPTDLKNHAISLKEYSSSVYKALNFVRTAIQWGLQLAQGPVGWVKIAIGLAKIFKEIMANRIDKKEILALNI